jgi:integrase
MALRRNHVDLENQTITSWRQKTRQTRTIPLTLRLQAMLATTCQGLLPDTLLQQTGGKAVVKGTDFLKKLWPRVGFHFRFHDLRHTFATRIAAATTNPFVVAALLGHSPAHVIYYRGAAVPRVTRRYIQPSLEELRAAVLEMERQRLSATKEQTT